MFINIIDLSKEPAFSFIDYFLLILYFQKSIDFCSKSLYFLWLALDMIPFLVFQGRKLDD